MGGAQVALVEGAAGLTANPAAAAVRPATSNDRRELDWNVDWLNPEIGSDFDNNGVPTTQVEKSFVWTGGAVGNLGPWGFGFNLNVTRFDVENGDVYRPSAEVGRLVVARSFRRDVWTVGVGVRTGRFSLQRVEQPRNVRLIEIYGTGLELGGVWRPRDRSVRVGVAFAAPIARSEVEPSTCDPDAPTCEGFVLPAAVKVPWHVSVGFAWRRAATRWNQQVPTRWRDERKLILATDVVIVGAVSDGHGLEAYVNQRLQPSGRSVGVSLRFGAEYEWIPGWLRVRGGWYYEPARFRDADGDDVPGRLHVTLGAEVRVWSFCFWDERYRLRLALTADGAEHYGNGGLSLGLWH